MPAKWMVAEFESEMEILFFSLFFLNKCRVSRT